MFLLAALALLVLVVQLAWAADAPAGARRLKNLVDQCAFSIGDHQFNLCPVLDGNDGGWKVEFERRTPPTVTKTSYRINLKEPLKRDESLGHEQCPQGTWICQTSAMNLPNITSYRPGVNITAELTAARDNPKQGHVLHVRLHGGYYVYGAQKADLQFICDGSVDEPSTPTYSWTWNGTHTFQWRTRHACGSVRAKPQPPKDAPPPPQDSEDETSPPTDDEPEELVDGRPLSGRTVRSTMILLLSSFTAVVTLTYLAWHPPSRVRQYVARFVKAHPRLGRWRVGESVLVRWAYEDLEMGEEFGYGEGEEDTMVNFAPEEEAGEGIPLKPSPRKGRWPSYGTA